MKRSPHIPVHGRHLPTEVLGLCCPGAHPPPGPAPSNKTFEVRRMAAFFDRLSVARREVEDEQGYVVVRSGQGRQPAAGCGLPCSMKPGSGLTWLDVSRVQGCVANPFVPSSQAWRRCASWPQTATTAGSMGSVHVFMLDGWLMRLAAVVASRAGKIPASRGAPGCRCRRPRRHISNGLC